MNNYVQSLSSSVGLQRPVAESDEQVGGRGKNVILKVAVEDDDLVSESAGGWNLGEFRSLKRIAPEDISVISDEERQKLIEIEK